MTAMLRFFRPEVEVALKVTFVLALASAFLATFTWGYEGRREARRWREVACAARLGELERVTPGAAIRSGSPCETLDRIGIAVAVARPAETAARASFVSPPPVQTAARESFVGDGPADTAARASVATDGAVESDAPAEVIR